MSNKVNVFTPLGATNHSKGKRAESDFYSTDPSAITLLDKYGLLDKDVPYWECACGGGNLSKELIRLGYDVPLSTDLFNRGYGDYGVDFLHQTKVFDGNIITNPPYRDLTEFILKGLELASNKLYIFARIQTLESVGRYNKIFKYWNPSLVCPFVKRIPCYHSGKTQKYSSTICYAWFIWDKNYDGDTKIKWLI